MIDYNQAAQIARVYDFYFFETCNCGGGLMHGYRHKTKEFYISMRPRKRKFTLRAGTHKNAPGIFSASFDQLENTIIQHVQTV